MFEYMLQLRESSWGFLSTLQNILNLLLVNVKRSSAEINEIKCFEFGSILGDLATVIQTKENAI